MANQYMEYPYIIEKGMNGGYVVRDITDPRKFYAFSTQADLTYWIGLNEQAPAVTSPVGTINVGSV